MSFHLVRTALMGLCLAAWHATAQVPAFISVNPAGGARQNSGNAVAVDASGNVYVAGSFGLGDLAGQIDFGTTNLVSAGESDGFLAKFNPQGECLWARQITGADEDDAYGLTVRSDGSVLVTGEFLGSTTIGATTLVSAGGYDIFVAAYSSTGNVLWARRIGGTLDDFSIALASGPNQSAMFTGSFSGNINLGGGITFSSSDDDALLVKLDAAGTVQWARSGGGMGFQLGSDVKVDTQGNVLWAGEFEANISFTGTNLSSASLNVFLAKYDSSGNRVWVRKLGEGEEADLPRLAVRPDGRFLCTAVYAGAYSIGNQSLPPALDDILVASFNAAGTLEWANAIGGNELDVCTDLLLDPSGDFYLTGYFRGSMLVGSSNLVSAGSTDIFLARCNAGGQMLGATRAGGLGPDLPLGAAFGSAGDIRLTGSFSGTAHFGNLSATSTDGLPKAFLATLSQPPTLQITPASSHVLLSWPIHFAGLYLESTSNLAEPTWTRVTNPPNVINGQFVVTNQVSGLPQFFRLRN